jgi:hypothetical protein
MMEYGLKIQVLELTLCCSFLNDFPCELKACSNRTLSSMLHSSKTYNPDISHLQEKGLQVEDLMGKSTAYLVWKRGTLPQLDNRQEKTFGGRILMTFSGEGSFVL